MDKPFYINLPLLLELWELYKDNVPLDKFKCTTVSFLGFPISTHEKVIREWFKNSNTGFHVNDIADEIQLLGEIIRFLMRNFTGDKENTLYNRAISFLYDINGLPEQYPNENKDKS